MTATRVIPPAAAERDGTVFETGIVTAEDQHQELHREEHTRSLTPHEQRLAAEDKWIPPNPGADETYTSGRVSVITPQKAMEKLRRGDDVQLTEAPASASSGREIAREISNLRASAKKNIEEAARRAQRAMKGEGTPEQRELVRRDAENAVAFGETIKKKLGVEHL